MCIVARMWIAMALILHTITGNCDLLHMVEAGDIIETANIFYLVFCLI